MAEKKSRKVKTKAQEDKEAEATVEIHNEPAIEDVAAPSGAATDTEEATAKAGKRSTKALKEAEEKSRKRSSERGGRHNTAK